MKRFSSLLVIIVLASKLFSQSYRISEVFFWVPALDVNAFVKIRNDHTDHLYNSSETRTKSWAGNGNIAPVAYVSGCTPRVEAKFVINPVPPPDPSCSSPLTNTAKGEVYMNNVLIAKLPPKKLDQNNSYPPTNFMEPGNEGNPFSFEIYKVQFIPELAIKWSLSNSPEDEYSWSSAGETKHRVYVTHDYPSNYFSPNGEATTFYESSIHLSTLNANGEGNVSGAKSSENVVVSIFNEFKDRCVNKYNETECMKYWGNLNATNNQTIKELFKHKDASCGAWVNFLHDMFKIQGVYNTEISTLTYGEDYNFGESASFLTNSQQTLLESQVHDFFGAESTNVEYIEFGGKVYGYFFVNNWDFNSDRFYLHRSPPNEDLDYINIPNSSNFIWPAEKDGEAAQGNSNPLSVFYNHVIVNYQKTLTHKVYFDPSYGTPNMENYFNDLYGFEATSISGYGTLFFYNNSNISDFPIEIIWLNEIENGYQQISIH